LVHQARVPLEKEDLDEAIDDQYVEDDSFKTLIPNQKGRNFPDELFGRIREIVFFFEYKLADFLIFFLIL
jgi:hypothetical protein